MKAASYVLFGVYGQFFTFALLGFGPFWINIVLAILCFAGSSVAQIICEKQEHIRIIGIIKGCLKVETNGEKS